MPSEWVAYQLDSAVSTFGIIIENASQETIEVNEGRHIPKYTLKQLLTPGFVIEREGKGGDMAADSMGVDGIMVDEV